MNHNSMYTAFVSIAHIVYTALLLLFLIVKICCAHIKLEILPFIEKKSFTVAL